MKMYYSYLTQNIHNLQDSMRNVWPCMNAWKILAHTVMYDQSNDVSSVTHKPQCLCKPRVLKIYTCSNGNFLSLSGIHCVLWACGKVTLALSNEVPNSFISHSVTYSSPTPRHVMHMWLWKNSITSNRQRLTSSSHFCATYEALMKLFSTVLFGVGFPKHQMLMQHNVIISLYSLKCWIVRPDDLYMCSSIHLSVELCRPVSRIDEMLV